MTVQNGWLIFYRNVIRDEIDLSDPSRTVKIKTGPYKGFLRMSLLEGVFINTSEVAVNEDYSTHEGTNFCQISTKDQLFVIIGTAEEMSALYEKWQSSL